MGFKTTEESLEISTKINSLNYIQNNEIIELNNLSNLTLQQTSIGEAIEKALPKIFNLIENKISFKKIAIKLDNAIILISPEFVKELKNYFGIFTKIKDSSKIIKLKMNTCQNNSICNKKYSKLFQEELSLDQALINPLKYYMQLILEIITIKSCNDNECAKCLNGLLKKIITIKEKLEQTLLISKFLNFSDSIKKSSLEIIYEKIATFEIKPESHSTTKDMVSRKDKLLGSYFIGPFTVNIYSVKTQNEPVYYYNIHSDLVDLYKIIDLFEKEIDNKQETPLKLDEYYNIDQLTEIRKKQAASFIDINFSEIDPKTRNLIIEYLSYHNTALISLMPYLNDDLIDEIFIDNPYSNIYIDHRKFGRCRTDKFLSVNEFEKIITYIRAISGLRLDQKLPTLKTDLITNKFHVRITVDIAPLAVDKFHIDIRKLRKRYFTIPELIFNKTINSKIASYLYFCLLRKRNFIIIGKPGDGKTTLLNALDCLTPPHWRKITIEDVTESIPQNGMKHQMRLQVDSFEKQDSKFRKSTEITRLLHRSPDYLLISEIQAPEDSKALFHAISAGLRGLYTCHGNSINDLLLRWAIHHDIPVISFNQLDSLIHIKKFDYRGELHRKVVEISEINSKQNEIFSQNNLYPEMISIFKWEPNSNEINQKADLYETPVVKKIKEYENIERDEFYEEINCYQTLFELLTRNEVFSFIKITDFFNKLYSYQTEMNLRNRQIDWDQLIIWGEKNL